MLQASTSASCAPSHVCTNSRKPLNTVLSLRSPLSLLMQKPMMSVTSRHVPGLYGENISLDKDAVHNNDCVGHEVIRNRIGDIGQHFSLTLCIFAHYPTGDMLSERVLERRTVISAQLHDGDGLGVQLSNSTFNLQQGTSESRNTYILLVLAQITL